MNCYVCDKEITSDNETYEHIIINAAGGRLKSKGLICKKCNSDFGSGIDASLASQMNMLANMLLIKRQKGNPQPIIGVRKSTGRKYELNPHSIAKLAGPAYTRTINGENETINVTARSEEELRRILNNLAKKIDFDVDEVIKKAQWNKDQSKEPLQFNLQVGGDDVFRAVCKCAANFFVFNKGDTTQIKHFIPYIKGEKGLDCVWMHYQDNIYDLKENECFHLLHLVGNSKERFLYCYVDYFNTYKYIVLLNDNYHGRDIEETYSFDVINVKQDTKPFLAKYDRETLLNFFTNKDAQPFERAQRSFNRSLSIAAKMRRTNLLRMLIGKAVQNSLGKYPSGTRITEEIIAEAVREIIKETGPFLVRIMEEDD